MCECVRRGERVRRAVAAMRRQMWVLRGRQSLRELMGDHRPRSTVMGQSLDRARSSLARMIASWGCAVGEVCM